MTRGIRNNNPMNLRRRDDIEWFGESESLDAEDPGFEVFEHAIFGIRAGVKNLYNGYLDAGLTTPRAIMGRYAPESDGNDPERYARYIARSLGIEPSASVPMELEYIRRLTDAIIEFENGDNPYPEWLVAMAVMLALTT